MKVSEDDLEYTLSDELLAKMKSVSITAFIKSVFESGYPLVTRKLLLVRQKLPRKTVKGATVKDFSEVTFEAAERVKNVAKTNGWTVEDLAGNNATQQNILAAFEKLPDFVLWYGHCYGVGACNNLAGQENDQLVSVIGSQAGHVQLLSGRTVNANCCLTAANVGLQAINAKAVAYLGYTLYLGFVTGALPLAPLFTEIEEDFIKGVNAPTIALLEGATYEAAFKKGWDVWDQKYDKWVTKCTPPPGQSLTKEGQKLCQLVLPAFLDNRNGLDRLGNPKAVARPIGIVVHAS